MSINDGDGVIVTVRIPGEVFLIPMSFWNAKSRRQPISATMTSGVDQAMSRKLGSPRFVSL